MLAMIEVICLKKTWNMISVGSLWLMLTGLVLSLLTGGGAAAIETAARICLAAAVALFIASALLRPRALRAEAAGRIAGMEAVNAAPSCGFSDVAANEEARRSLEGLVDYLKDPQKYARYGARMPRGVLLYGRPARARRCWRALWPGRRAFRSSRSPARTLYRCMSA